MFSALHLYRMLSPIMKPFAVCYGMAMRLRRHFPSKAFRPDCPCVAVGNISWGGTGKTPITEYLLTLTESCGLKTAVLSRGYRSQSRRFPLVVTPHMPPEIAGDEPLMLAQKHPEAKILIDPLRSRSAELACAQFHPDLLLLDDGFQHLSVRKDLNLVLLTPEDLLQEWNKVIPSGSWREDVSALHYADAFLIKCDPTLCHQYDDIIGKRLSAFEKPVFFFSLSATSLRREADGSLSMLSESGYALLTAIGRPQQFIKSATAFLHAMPSKTLIYPDHHSFSQQDADRISSISLPVVCTEKDAVKLRKFSLSNLYILETEISFGSNMYAKQPFPTWFLQTLFPDAFQDKP
ncbi:MAG: tetraacyldisaccharide 4'-kinase [Desulfovibrionaceae bacterium]|nr:tetraacyldisaccharide 4'-kinase [Desulfovibrionaceae bacterium]